MKIIIAGASVGGLVAAYELGQQKHDVIVFDEKSYEDLAYNWYDFVWPDFLKRKSIQNIEFKYFRKDNMSFSLYGYDKIIRLNQAENVREYAIHRKELSHALFKQASEVATIYLNTRIDSLLVEDNSIKGIVINGKELKSDLVIDNLGIFSILRKSLPKEVHIEREINNNSIMFAYRAFFRTTNAVVEDTTKCYLRHLGKDGIAWVNVEKDNVVDVLVGRIGSLTLEEAEEALSSLRSENPCIGERLSGGNTIHPIPVRYPSTRLFCDGYVMIGDSGFMCVPLLGSGMYSSVVAADILSDVLKGKDSVSESCLYCYQQRFYSEIGASFFEMDVIKNFLLMADIKQLIPLLADKVIDTKDMTDIYNSKPFDYGLGELITKAMRGWKHPFLLIKMMGLLNQTKKIRRLVKKMPKEYDDYELFKWQQRIDKFFTNKQN